MEKYEKPIPVGEFYALVELLHQNENGGFGEQYKVQYVLNYYVNTLAGQQ